jgi:hypothetical protein
MNTKVSTFAEIYDSKILSFNYRQEAVLLNGKVLTPNDIHLWINKDNIFENYITNDFGQIDFMNKKFLMIRFLGIFCDEHQVFHPSILTNERIRYYAYYVLSKVASLVSIAMSKEQIFKLTIKTLKDILFEEANTYPFNDYDLSCEDFSQSMSETTYQNRLRQLKVETTTKKMEIKQIRQNIDQRHIHTTFSPKKLRDLK